MKSIRSKILNGVIFSFCAALLLSTTILATSKSWSFTMKKTYVNGKDNGVVYSMTKGQMTVSGKVYVDSKDKGANTRARQIKTEVWEDKFLFDKKIGTAYATPSTSKAQTLYAYLGERPKGKYYLVTSKATDDGWNISANGTFVTK